MVVKVFCLLLALFYWLRHRGEIIKIRVIWTGKCRYKINSWTLYCKSRVSFQYIDQFTYLCHSQMAILICGKVAEVKCIQDKNAYYNNAMYAATFRVYTPRECLLCAHLALCLQCVLCLSCLLCLLVSASVSVPLVSASVSCVC